MRPWRFRPARDLELAPAARLTSVRREPGLVGFVTSVLWGAWVRTYLRLFHRMHVIGETPLPSAPPFVVVANHTSHLDALVLAAVMPWRLAGRAYALAAGDVFFESLGLSMFAAFFVNALPMRRRKASTADLKDLRTRLVEEPCTFILFPEGGRMRDGLMGPFKPGIGMLVAGAGVPVVPCHIEGAFQAWPAGRRLPHPTRITVRIGRPLSFETMENSKEGWLSVATRLEDAVRALAPA